MTNREKSPSELPFWKSGGLFAYTRRPSADGWPVFCPLPGYKPWLTKLLPWLRAHYDGAGNFSRMKSRNRLAAE